MRTFVAALCALLLGACQQTAVAPVAKPALWRATDADTVIWLFGTIHLLPPGEEWRGGPVGQAIAESDTLITEIPEGDAQAQAAAFLALARVDGLPPLSERVPPGQHAALAKAVAASEIPVAALDRMTDWGAALALTARLANGAGATRQDAPEAVLAAAFAGRRHEALETFAGQLGVFATLSAGAQRQLLAAALDSARDPRGDYNRLLAAWRAGDTAAIVKTFEQAFAGAPELEVALVTGRNRAWADELTRRAAGPGVLLVAVGAGHMVGRDGLPGLLSARGFRVARVQ